MAQNDSESLKRSHSKWSNTKLTLLCLLATFAVSLLWVSLAALVSNLDKIHSLSIIGLVAGGILTVLSLFFFAKFKR